MSEDFWRVKSTKAKREAEDAQQLARTHGAARKDVEEKARGLLFDLVLKQRKFKATIEEYKKRWPDQAEEMERIEKDVSAGIDNDEEGKKDIRRRVAANI